MWIDWAVAERPMPGHLLSGDAGIVEPFDGGALVAVIDALGHGDDAAATARLAAETLREQPREAPDVLLDRCHRRLRAVRGAVISVASYDSQRATMTWSGVGNVEGVLLRADPHANRPREWLLLHNGVVGYQLPTVRTAALRLHAGDTLILASDGVSSGFADAWRGDGPQATAREILDRYAKGTDDALALVATYRGVP